MFFLYIFEMSEDRNICLEIVVKQHTLKTKTK